MKFSDLVVKCLIKHTKVLQSTIYELDLDRILQSIHVYLQELGMEEIRRRAEADDRPLRIVKTVLHELVKLRGTAIKGHLSMVSMDMEPQPIILGYIDLNLQTLAAANPMPASHSADANPMAASHSADAQLKHELAAILKKIADKQTYSIGLYELYRITQLYPKVDIFSEQNTSEAFQTYIRASLAQMEKNAAARRTPSSVPMPTPLPSARPPPSAINLPSQNYAPLSPVHTNSLNDGTSVNTKSDPTNFGLPPSSYAEDDRSVNVMASRGPIPIRSNYGYHQEEKEDHTNDSSVNVMPSRGGSILEHVDDQGNDRLQSGVSNSGIDATRERIKSIQLGSVGSPKPVTRPKWK